VTRTDHNILGLPTQNPEAPKTLTATVVIRNDGTKTIKAIDWNFPFPHILNKKPELRYAIHSKVRIKPGETRTICGPISKSAKGFNISQGNGPAHSVTLISTQEGISITVPVANLRGGVQDHSHKIQRRLGLAAPMSESQRTAAERLKINRLLSGC